MINKCRVTLLLSITSTLVSASAPQLNADAGSPAAYRIVQSTQISGTGGIDYVYADSGERRLYVPRGAQIETYNLDTLAPAGSLPNTRAHGVVVDPLSGHGFSTSNPVAMWNRRTLALEKTIEVKGRPDGLFLEPATDEIYILSHAAPNVTAINAKTGEVVAAFDLGGAPEQGVSDGKGRVYIDIEDKNKVAVVNARSHQVVGNYVLGENRTPAGLALDVKNGILFVFCREPQNCVVLDAADGRILATLPIGKGTDGGGFNPATMEAFSSQGDGTLTIITEHSPSSFTVTQTVTTKPHAKTCTLDSAKNRIVVIATEPLPNTNTVTPAPIVETTSPTAPRPQGRAGTSGPALLDILVIGREAPGS